jgi:hypothetical protein
MEISERRGFSSMLGSIDYMHWHWGKCPYAWKGMYTCGDHNIPIIILEAICLCLDSCPLHQLVNLYLRALNPDGDARRTQAIYIGTGRECPSSSGRGGLVLFCTKVLVVWVTSWREGCFPCLGMGSCMWTCLLCCAMWLPVAVVLVLVVRGLCPRIGPCLLLYSCKGRQRLHMNALYHSCWIRGRAGAWRSTTEEWPPVLQVL